MRASGLPVTSENLEARHKEWQEVYDKVSLRYKEPTAWSIKLLNRLERIIDSKYPVVEHWDILKTKKSWKEKVIHYGPIAMALNEDKKELVYVIIDVPM